MTKNKALDAALAALEAPCMACGHPLSDMPDAAAVEELRAAIVALYKAGKADGAKEAAKKADKE